MKGHRRGCYRSQWSYQWARLSRLVYQTRRYIDCAVDQLLLLATADNQTAHKLLNQRVKLLAQSIGESFDLDTLKNQSTSQQVQQYKQILQQHGYTISQADAELNRQLKQKRPANTRYGR